MTGNMEGKWALRLVELDRNRQRIMMQSLSEKPNQTLAVWKASIDLLYQQQLKETQCDMFSQSNEMVLVQQIVDAPKVSAKAMRLGVPTDANMPLVRAEKSASVAEMFDHYIYDLISWGHTKEATAVSNLYTLLVATGQIRIKATDKLALPTREGAPQATVAESIHAEIVDNWMATAFEDEGIPVDEIESLYCVVLNKRDFLMPFSVLDVCEVGNCNSHVVVLKNAQNLTYTEANNRLQKYLAEYRTALEKMLNGLCLHGTYKPVQCPRCDQRHDDPQDSRNLCPSCMAMEAYG